jgi:hypothetical protein
LCQCRTCNGVERGPKGHCLGRKRRLPVAHLRDWQLRG